MSEPSDPATGAPRSIVLAARLYVVAAVLGVVGAVVVAVLIPTSIAANIEASRRVFETQRSATPLTLEQIQQGATTLATLSSALSIVLSIVFAALFLLLAPRLRRGGTRARTALVALAALQVFGVLGAYGIGFLHFLVSLAALVLTVLPASNAWFRAVREGRPAA